MGFFSARVHLLDLADIESYEVLILLDKLSDINTVIVAVCVCYMTNNQLSVLDQLFLSYINKNFSHMQSSFECSAYEDRLNVLKEPCSSVIVPCKLREQEKKKKTRNNVVILFSPLKFPREFFSVTLRKKVKLSLKKLKKEQ